MNETLVLRLFVLPFLFIGFGFLVFFILEDLRAKRPFLLNVDQIFEIEEEPVVPETIVEPEKKEIKEISNNSISTSKKGKKKKNKK